MKLGVLDIAVFAAYFVGVVIFGVVVAARSKTKSSDDFFLASKKLPWYAVGASYIASNISTEHFIGMVGWGFLYGMAVANWEWGNILTFTLLIWVFLPFYLRGNVATMPEWLERRYNPACRYIYAGVQIIGLVIAMLGGVLYAGAKAMSVFFPGLPMWGGVLILAAAAGVYTIYGGLLSAAWVDLLQFCLLMVGGTVVTVYGVYHAGGVGPLFEDLPEKFIMFYPSTHEYAPWTGLLAGLLTVGLWYNCANQFMVQRCLGARSEWDARMGIVMAGFSKAILPLIVAVPGIIAFYLFQDRISDGDRAWPFLVRQFLPAGFIGLVLAGLASAILSTLSAITTSSATIFSLDIYRAIFRKHAPDKEMHLVARLSGAGILVIGAIIALVLAAQPTITVFGLIQQVFFYVAGPIVAVFLVGILWRRATPQAAAWTLVLGFAVILPVVIWGLFGSDWGDAHLPFLKFLRIEALQPYDSFMHHTFAVFLISTALFVTISLATKPKPADQLTGVIWTPSALRTPEDERAKNKGFKSLTLWWALMAAVIIGLYVFTNARGSGSRGFEAETLGYAVTGEAEAFEQARGELLEEITAQKEEQLARLEAAGGVSGEELERIERRDQVFNLFTGKTASQIVMEAEEAGAALTFQLPVKKAGRYRIAAIVTIGPDYGPVSARVNGESTPIAYPETVIEHGGYEVVHRETDVLDAAALAAKSLRLEPEESSAGTHTVRRIRLGVHALEPKAAEVAFIAEGPGRMGVDQFVLTRVEAQD